MTPDTETILARLAKLEAAVEKVDFLEHDIQVLSDEVDTLSKLVKDNLPSSRT
jgi:hypothetical protein